MSATRVVLARQSTATSSRAVPSRRPPWPPSQRLAAAPVPGDDLLEAAAAGPDDRVLVVGGERADLLCAALRRGCRSALGVVAPQRHSEPADLVVAPRIASRDEAFAVAEYARRALRSGACHGRLAIGLIGAAATAAGRLIVRGLRSYGFERARLRARAEGGVLLVCDLSPAAPSGAHPPRS